MGMVGFRYWEMQRGKIPVPNSAKFDLSYRMRVFAEWEKKLWDEGKHWSIRFGTQTLRVAIMGMDRARIEMRKLIAKMEEALVKRHAKTPQGAPSFFLKDIAEHKKKMRIRPREIVDSSVFVDKT